MLTKKSALIKVREFAEEINNSGLPLKRVILFGSFAQNKQHNLSDIDVALVSDNFSGVGYYDIALFGKTLIKKPFRSIQTKTFNTKNFSSANNPFVQEIIKTGIEINL